MTKIERESIEVITSARPLIDIFDLWSLFFILGIFFCVINVVRLVYVAWKRRELAKQPIKLKKNT
jgi:uncharacterized membrane protein YvlD (DUF360 family)